MAQPIICEGSESVKVELKLKNPWGDFPTDPEAIRRIAKILGGLACCERIVQHRVESFTAAQRKSRNESFQQ